MTYRKGALLLLFFLVFLFTRQLLGITTVQTEVACPVCQVKNKFLAFASWGSYVYQWPSRFQLVFWPFTYGQSLYSCKKCHFTAFLDDFTNLPKEKAGEVLAALGDTHLAKEYPEYTAIPMSERLPLAEKSYRVLGKDDEFWCHFYRVEGFHFEAESKAAEAAAARAKALELAQKLAADPKNADRLKELLVISGAMKHFLGRDNEALADLRTASTKTFKNPAWKEENAKGYDSYLSGLIKDYMSGIQNNSIPVSASE